MIRTGNFKVDEVYLKPGDIFTLTTRNIEGDQNIVSVSWARDYQTMLK